MMKTIKTLALAVFGLLTAMSAGAQSNTNHINISTGILYERGADATISLVHETKYHNAWEYFATGYVKWDDCPTCGHVCPKSFWNNYRTWTFGVAYKPCVMRGKNSHGNLRLGASLGSDFHDFLYLINIGYEHTYALYKGVNIFWQVRTDIAPEGQDLFRTGVAVGLGIPIN